MLDNKVMDMTPGEALLEAPIGELIQRVAASIAEAQLKLDQIGVRVASLLSEAKVTFNKTDGTPVERSLLELGFMPTFYAFTETDIEVKMTIQLKVDEEFKVTGTASVGETGAAGQAGAGGKTGAGSQGGADSQTGSGLEQAKRVVPFGISINAEYHRKYGFDMSGSSSVKTRLLAVPPPSVFLEAIKDHARSQSLAREGETTTPPGTTTPSTTTPTTTTPTTTTPTDTTPA